MHTIAERDKLCGLVFRAIGKITKQEIRLNSQNEDKKHGVVWQQFSFQDYTRLPGTLEVKVAQTGEITIITATEHFHHFKQKLEQNFTTLQGFNHHRDDGGYVYEKP